MRHERVRIAAAVGFDAIEVFAALDKIAVFQKVAADVVVVRRGAAAVAVVERVLVEFVVVAVVGLAVVEAKIHSDPGPSGRVSRQHLAPAGPYAQCDTR